MNWFKKNNRNLEHFKKSNNLNDILFIRREDYDNSLSNRKFEENAIHCWAIWKKDFQLLKEITDDNWVVVNVDSSDVLKAVRFSEVDDYVTFPTLEEYVKDKWKEYEDYIYSQPNNKSRIENLNIYGEEIKKDLAEEYYDEIDSVSNPKIEDFDLQKHVSGFERKTYWYNKNDLEINPDETYLDFYNPYEILVFKK